MTYGIPPYAVTWQIETNTVVLRSTDGGVDKYIFRQCAKMDLSV